MIVNIVSYSCLFLICFQRGLSNGMVLSGSIEVCEELDQPTGWTIKDLREVNVWAWPWKCLNSRYTNESLRAAIQDLSSDVIDAVKKNYKGFAQYYMELENMDLEKIERLKLLSIAVGFGHLDLVKYLVNEKKATVNSVGFNGATPIERAVAGGHLNVIRFLVRKNASIDVKTPSGLNLLHQAVHTNRVDIMKYFLDELKMSNKLEERVGLNNHTVLMRSITVNAPKVAKYLIEERNSSITQTDSNGYSLLHLAVGAHSLTLVQYLIAEKGMDPLVKDNRGRTPYYYAQLHSKKYRQVFNYIRNRTLTQHSATTSDELRINY